MKTTAWIVVVALLGLGSLTLARGKTVSGRTRSRSPYAYMKFDVKQQRSAYGVRPAVVFSGSVIQHATGATTHHTSTVTIYNASKPAFMRFDARGRGTTSSYSNEGNSAGGLVTYINGEPGPTKSPALYGVRIIGAGQRPQETAPQRLLSLGSPALRRAVDKIALCYGLKGCSFTLDEVRLRMSQDRGHKIGATIGASLLPGAGKPSIPVTLSADLRGNPANPDGKLSLWRVRPGL